MALSFKDAEFVIVIRQKDLNAILQHISEIYRKSHTLSQRAKEAVENENEDEASYTPSRV